PCTIWRMSRWGLMTPFSWAMATKVTSRTAITKAKHLRLLISILITLKCPDFAALRRVPLHGMHCGPLLVTTLANMSVQFHAGLSQTSPHQDWRQAPSELLDRFENQQRSCPRLLY